MGWLTNKMKVISNDPFTEAALTIMNDNLEQVLRADPSNIVMSGTFYQQDSSKSVVDKLREEANNWEEAELTIADVSDKDLKKYFTKVAGEDLTINRYVGKGIYAGKTLKIRPSDAGSSFN